MSLSYEKRHMPEACRLVGTYFWHWSSMELLLNNLIGKALKLEPVAEAIICANLKLKDKGPHSEDHGIRRPLPG